jgi:hypothetical protein
VARVELNSLIVTTAAGTPLYGADGATVLVRLRGTSTNATVYQEATGTSTWTSPYTTAAGKLKPTGSTGELWVEEGQYDLNVTPTGGGSAVTHRVEAKSAVDAAVIDVTAAPYFAKGDGTTDDVAAIQAAITDAQTAAASGGRVRVRFPKPAVSYRLIATTTGGGLTWHLAITGSRVILDFEPGATLYSTHTTAQPLFVVGAGKPAGASSWANYWLGDATKATYHAMTAAAKGDKKVTSANLVSAGITVGDYVHIRTGQLLASRLTEPDAELNQVTAVSGNDVFLRWPLGKPYVQEYFVTGTNGLTSTSVTANLATFGVAKVTDRVISDIEIRGLTFDTLANTTYVIQTLGVDGAKIHGLRGTTGHHVVNNIETNRTDFRDWDVISNPSTSGTYRWVYAYGTTAGRAVIRDIKARGAGARMMVAHYHEGSFDIDAADIDVTSPLGNNDSHAVSIAARAYGHRHRRYRLRSDETGPPFYVSSACGQGDNLIENVTVTNGDGADGIQTDAIGWGIDVDNQQIVVEPARPTTSTRLEVLRAWVTAGVPTVDLGSIPPGVRIKEITLYVAEAFNGGTDTISIGWAAVPTAITVAQAVTTTGDKTPSYGAFAKIRLTTSQAIQAYHADTGTATTGRALVEVFFTRIPTMPAANA